MHHHHAGALPIFDKGDEPNSPVDTITDAILALDAHSERLALEPSPTARRIAASLARIARDLEAAARELELGQ
jgi:hypothetical protein